MAFVIDETVLHIKLTNKGRELLSRGKLKFTQFAIGDSEIDYNYIRENNIDIGEVSVLRPVDGQPEIFNFVLKRQDSANLQPLPSSISNIVSDISNTADPRGMFDLSDTPKYFTDPKHVKQADAQVDNSTVNGGRTLNITQHPDYGSNPAEPIAGDYIVVKWGNPEYTGDLNSNEVAKNKIPQLFYKIVSIDSGKLSTNDLVVTVDRDIPNFNGAGTGSSRIIIYPNNNNRAVSGDSILNFYGAPFVTDFLTEAMLSFEENFDTPTIDVPVWNMTIIFTEEIAGVQPTDKPFNEIPSAKFGNFVRYIERLDDSIKNIGVIHYTNLSPSNIYGEGFYFEINNVERSPRLNLPTIMWYNDSVTDDGLFLKPDFNSLDIYDDLGIEYMYLIDNNEKVVGKIFPDLKIFVIEDQELLYAMSYKSNRNWTMPQISGGFNIEKCD